MHPPPKDKKNIPTRIIVKSDHEKVKELAYGNVTNSHKIKASTIKEDTISNSNINC